ncbi:MAG: ankyrin repeat domain-containing protein [Pyrinomonadaceae bacterium]
MSKKSFIDSVKVGEACSEDWEKMDGNDRFRFCSHCSKHVNNLSEMTRKEAARFVRASDGNICIRYIVDPRSQRPMFANQLHQIARRAPGLTAGVMTASMALSTAAYAQTGTPIPQTSTPVIEQPIKTDTSDGSATNKPVVELKPIVELPRTVETMTMGIMVSTITREFKNPISMAVLNEDIDEIIALIAQGKDVNGRESDKTTPIFAAIESGEIEIVSTLLDHGAKINVRDKQKQTPLMQLDSDATPELIALLVRHGVKINLSDNDGNTALILAATSVSTDVLKALIDAGADVNLSNKEGQTALMNAAEANDLESVRALLLAGAKVNARNKEGDNAWDLTSDDEIEQLLASFGAEVSEDDQPLPPEKPTLSTIIQ